MAVVTERASSLEFDTKLREWGTSRAVRIPKRMCDAVGVAVGDGLDMVSGFDERGPYILIRPARQHRSYGDVPMASLDDLFGGYDGDGAEAFDWGKDAGEEIAS